MSEKHGNNGLCGVISFSLPSTVRSTTNVSKRKGWIGTISRVSEVVSQPCECVNHTNMTQHPRHITIYLQFKMNTNTVWMILLSFFCLTKWPKRQWPAAAHCDAFSLTSVMFVLHLINCIQQTPMGRLLWPVPAASLSQWSSLLHKNWHQLPFAALHHIFTATKTKHFSVPARDVTANERQIYANCSADSHRGIYRGPIIAIKFYKRPKESALC